MPIGENSGDNIITKKLRVEIEATMLGVMGVDKLKHALRDFDLSGKKAAAERLRGLKAEERATAGLYALKQRLERETLMQQQANADKRIAAEERYKLKVRQTYDLITRKEAEIAAIRERNAAVGAGGGLGTGFLGLGRFAKPIGMGAAAVGAAALYGGYRAVAANAQWRSYLSQTQGMSRLTGRQMGIASNTAWNLATTMGANPQDIISAYRYGSDYGFGFGLNQRSIRAATRTALPLGGKPSDWLLTIGTVGRNFPAYRNDPNAIANMVLEAGRYGRTDPNVFAASVSRSLMTAGHFHNNALMPQTLAAVSALSIANGGDAQEASMLYYNMLSKIAAPSPGVVKNLAFLRRRTGIDLTGDFGDEALRTKGISGILADFHRANLTPGALKHLFPDIRAWQAMMALSGNQYGAYTGAVPAIMNAPQTNPAGQNYRRYMGQLTTDMAKLGNTFGHLANTIGGQLEPSVHRFIRQGIIPLVQGLDRAAANPAIVGTVKTVMNLFTFLEKLNVADLNFQLGLLQGAFDHLKGPIGWIIDHIPGLPHSGGSSGGSSSGGRHHSSIGRIGPGTITRNRPLSSVNASRTWHPSSPTFFGLPKVPPSPWNSTQAYQRPVTPNEAGVFMGQGTAGGYTFNNPDNLGPVVFHWDVPAAQGKPYYLPGGKGTHYRVVGIANHPTGDGDPGWVITFETDQGAVFTVGNIDAKHLRKGLTMGSVLHGGVPGGYVGRVGAGEKGPHIHIVGNQMALNTFNFLATGGNKKTRVYNPAGSGRPGLNVPASEKPYVGAFRQSGKAHHVDPAILAALSTPEGYSNPAWGKANSGGYGSMGVQVGKYGYGAKGQIGGAGAMFKYWLDWARSSAGKKSRHDHRDVLEQYGYKSIDSNQAILFEAAGAYANGIYWWTYYPGSSQYGPGYAKTLLANATMYNQGHVPATYYTGKGANRTPTGGTGGTGGTGTPWPGGSASGGYTSYTGTQMQMVQSIEQGVHEVGHPKKALWGPRGHAYRTAVNGLAWWMLQDKLHLYASYDGPGKKRLIADAWKEYHWRLKNPATFMWHQEQGQSTKTVKDHAYWAAYYASDITNQQDRVTAAIGGRDPLSLHFTRRPGSAYQTVATAGRHMARDMYRQRKAELMQIPGMTSHEADKILGGQGAWKQEQWRVHHPMQFLHNQMAAGGSHAGGIIAWHITNRCKAEAEANVHRRRTAKHTHDTSRHTKRHADTLDSHTPLLQTIARNTTALVRRGAASSPGASPAPVHAAQA